jgi:tricorn protease interacting factor F2/3
MASMEIVSYDLDLDVDFRGAKVDGSVTIQLKKGERPFVLDAVDLEVTGAQVNGSAAPFRQDRKAGTVSVEGVPLGRSSVRVDYTKKVSDDVIFGLYKSKYGKEYVLATDLEPAEARTVFPCKDHPAFKAVFRVSVTTGKGLTVISNTPAASVKPSGAKVRHVFEPTPRMSTYLLFLGVGKFEEIRKRQAGKEVLVASRPKEAENGRFVLDVGADALEYYQAYFRVPYPLKKLHMIALPEYHTGAMENWGAITSREAYMLVDGGSSVSDRQGAGLVMAHEIAHQWFGDLVTMKWWDDLWLNESFATFMECKAIDKIRHDWDPWTFFLRTSTFRSQAADALSTTHPIQVEVKSPAEAGQVFDAISYGKGASVLRMIEAYVGEEAFRRGVTAYLRKFSYSNAAGQDFWMSVEKASGLPVSRIMGQWITKPGFPLVRVGYSKGKLRFSQSRFQLDGVEPKEVWPIPLTFELNGERRKALFDGREMGLDAPVPKSLSMNLGHTGYYSVLYAPELEETVAKGFGRRSPHEKGGFMSDLFLFLQAGKVTPEEYYRFVALCEKESHPLVVETVSDQLFLLTTIAFESKALSRAAARFAVAQMKRLGLSPRKGETPHDGVARESIASLASRLDTEYTGKLAALFGSYDTLNPDIKDAVGIAYARTHGEREYESLAKLVKSTQSEAERSRLYSALTAFRDPKLVERALELGISGEVSRSDSAYTMTRASANPLAREVLWKWIQRRHDRVWTLYAGSQQILLYYEIVIPRCAVGKVEEVRRFSTGEKMKKGHMAFRRIIESTEVRTRLRERLLAS